MSDQAALSTAVIIVNFNSGPLLRRCLDALKVQTYRDFRAYVVDNASSDSSAEGIETDYPFLTLIRPEANLGFAAGNNAGLRAAGNCRWIALLNPDAFPEPDWLEKFLAGAHRHVDCAFFGCKMLQADDPDRLDGTGDIYHVSGLAWRRDHGWLEAEGAVEDGEIFAPCAAAALYRRDVLSEVGGFDESFFCYFEDVDLAFRLRLRGYRCCYVADARVKHMGSAITGRRSDFSVYHGHRNLVWTYVKNMPPLLLWVYLPLHLVANLSGLLIYSLTGRADVIFKAKRDAIKGLGQAWVARDAIQSSRKVPVSELHRVMTKSLRALFQRN